MSCCHGSVPKQVRPGTARVLVTELSGSGHINPIPATKSCEDSETAVELYLSPEKLKSLCGTWDLSHVSSLEICMDTQENTLGNFGAYFPKLVQLKMNNSTIMSVRDLGTTLSHLQVLWMSRCSLQDLDGLPTLSSLKELYMAYNNVSDLSQVGMLENLQLLDLEGNDVDDLVQIQYLGLCDKLRTLTLEGNPVCVHPNPAACQTADYSYRAAVRELVPQLRYLDDLRVEEDGLSCNSTMGEDWAILRNSIRDRNSSRAATEDEETVDSACPYSRPGSARRPASSLSCVWPLSSAGSRPHTSSRPMSATRPGVLSPPGSRPGSADSDLATVEAETSILTHGAGKILFCGNPVQAIRARREKLRTAPTKSTFTPRDLPIHVPEHTYDLEEPDVRERVDVFAELRAWREQHSRCLQAIETERLPQVLAIRHSDEEEGYDDDDDDYDDDEEEEGFGVRNDSGDDEHVAEKHGDSRDIALPDSSFQSLSPDLHHRETVSPDVARLSLSPDSTLSPSPPLSATRTTGHRKQPGIRARRLLLSQTNSEHLPNFSVGRSPGTGSATGDTDLTLQRVQQLTRTDVRLLPLPAHTPRPPLTSALANGLMDSCAEMDSSSIQSGSKHLQTPKMSKLLDRPAITRPHTARAALQKHQQHHIRQPCRGSSHPD
ncbi:leucine-rich repeat-containing protein 56 isoform X2 [Cottoperca gobio]|uniref:Leucine-rich repeat-containing protein 56 isoform X2 n=1 Tax=Cottoperca gobio TaxID=56716 RepID=A0A6J2PTC8_COTGO|nr:leucine-rich repeat-containing protein 56 isoform X2 [Cottoperca gobio]